MLEVDIDTSTVEFAGRRFPAVGLVCPTHPDENPDAKTRAMRTLGGPYGIHHTKTEVYIPCENGLLVSVDDGRFLKLTVTLYVLECYESTDFSRHRGWLPAWVRLAGGQLKAEDFLRSRKPVPGNWFWDDADPEWTVELIDRISRFPLENALDGPPCEVVKLDELWALREGWKAEMDALHPLG